MSMITDQPVAPDLNAALVGLLHKYAVEPATTWLIADGRQSDNGRPGLLLIPGWSCPQADLPAETVPLLPWRSERRFVELQRLVAGQTIAPVLMGRFACLVARGTMPLEALLYREFDLAEWIGGSAIVSLFASLCDDVAANVILRLADGTIYSVETGVTLPDGAPLQDRHELIARRGVASDRTVDTQIAQSSVYTWNGAGQQQYTDVDFELFGLDAQQCSFVRAAYEALCRAEVQAACRDAHRRLRRLVELAYESDERGQRLTVEEREKA